MTSWMIKYAKIGHNQEEWRGGKIRVLPNASSLFEIKFWLYYWCESATLSRVLDNQALDNWESIVRLLFVTWWQKKNAHFVNWFWEEKKCQFCQCITKKKKKIVKVSQKKQKFHLKSQTKRKLQRVMEETILSSASEGKREFWQSTNINFKRPFIFLKFPLNNFQTSQC